MLSSLSPILIASPVHRSGTTLFQRLLCSTTDALIFGETLANDMTFFFAMLQNKQMLMGGNDDWRAKQLQKVLEGDVNEWIPDIMPDKDFVLAHFEATIYNYLKGYIEFAQQCGRSFWGTKLPAWQPPSLQVILKSMPKGKLIYVTRNLEDCVRSAKLIGYCKAEADINAFAQQWQQYQRMVKMALPKEQVLFLQYEALCQNTETTIAQIETFTGLVGIDRSVMNYRINNYNRSREQPPELTPNELAILKNYQIGTFA